MTDRSFDEEMMRRALAEAVKSGGFVNPNPLVGAVVVKDGRIIGIGRHERYGQLHAERNALASCTEDPRGGTIYVTLEPCCHYGKTPPCTEAIIERGLARVVYGSPDPNPLVAGKSGQILRAAGIQVEGGLLAEECDRINPRFFHYITTKTPFVTMKYAMTLDGKTACWNGESKWVTGPEARRHVHETRGLCMGIMTGIGTVLADDPQLTCRDAAGLDPVRIVCDSRLRTPLEARLLRDITCPGGTKGPGRILDPEILSTTDTFTSDDHSRYPRTILATCERNPAAQAPYLKAGADLLLCPEDEDGHLDLPILMKALGSLGMDSILLEGGSGLNWSALKAGLVHQVQAYAAPKLFGGRTANTPVGGAGVDHPADAVPLTDITVRTIGPDLLIEGRIPHPGEDAEIRRRQAEA